jgi:hypothetical protein
MTECKHPEIMVLGDEACGGPIWRCMECKAVVPVDDAEADSREFYYQITTPPA